MYKSVKVEFNYEGYTTRIIAMNVVNRRNIYVNLLIPEIFFV